MQIVKWNLKKFYIFNLDHFCETIFYSFMHCMYFKVDNLTYFNNQNTNRIILQKIYYIRFNKPIIENNFLYKLKRIVSTTFNPVIKLIL